MRKSYKRKAERVEAVQWKEHGDHPAVRRTTYEEVSELLKSSGCSKESPYHSWYVMGVLDTDRGARVVVRGDWIVSGFAGVRTYSPKEFEDRFEEVQLGQG